MFSSNGSVVAYRPANRVALCFRAAEQQAVSEDTRREQAARDESEAQELAHGLQAVASAAQRATAKYLAAKKVIGQLLVERRNVAEDAALCEGQRIAQLAAIDRAVADHRSAMVGCMKEFASDMGANFDVESAVAKDLAAVEDETNDRRGLHARTQPRDDKGRFDETE